MLISVSKESLSTTDLRFRLKVNRKQYCNFVIKCDTEYGCYTLDIFSGGFVFSSVFKRYSKYYQNNSRIHSTVRLVLAQTNIENVYCMSGELYSSTLYSISGNMNALNTRSRLVYL